MKMRSRSLNLVSSKVFVSANVLSQYFILNKKAYSCKSSLRKQAVLSIIFSHKPNSGICVIFENKTVSSCNHENEVKVTEPS